ncbi:sulfatase [Photobacterium satsumensis]|uniref:sulfatase n=1 Tax=Photobacterium satsumensis TaxID=2910239 RepID=UPI003D0C40AD
MKAIFLLFDSLNLKALSCYGGPIDTPNFDRLAQKSVRFNNHYVGSMPCMPARRDFHTGRYNFFHSAWGPMEPYDNSLPVILREKKKTYSHLITDHFHYFEDGGAGYHTKYDTWEFIRGQEYDQWIGEVSPPVDEFKEQYDSRHYNLAGDPRSCHKLQHLINRQHIVKDEDFPIHQCFDRAFSFLDKNQTEDNWFLHLECFDPHEPFHAPEKYVKKYTDKLDALVMDWPAYDWVTETEEEIQEVRARYAALVSMCDDYLGRLLDYMDAHNMWEDTALVMTTDHGYLLSEHGWWAKTRMPQYQEISHIPLMIYTPSTTDKAGEEREYTTSAIDIMPTFLDVFGIERPPEVQGVSLLSVVEQDNTDYRVVVSGIFGGSMLIADGQYAYHYFPKRLDSVKLYEYRLMPCHMRGAFSVDELRDMQLQPPFNFTKGIETLKIKARNDSKRPPGHDGIGFSDNGTRLFDVVNDPNEQEPISKKEVELNLLHHAKNIMQAHDAPCEMYERFELEEME